MTRHFLDICDLSPADLRAIVDDAHARKAARRGWPKGRVDAEAPARDRVLAMIFEKTRRARAFRSTPPSANWAGTRSSRRPATCSLGAASPIEDTARVLSRMVDAIMIRANRHDDVVRLPLRPIFRLSTA